MDQQMLVYKRVVPISATTHGELSLQQAGHYGFASRLNAVPLLAAEFPQASLDHPIVFLRHADKVFPVAVMGLRPDRNEHVGTDGVWDGSYLPAFLRRYPFILARDLSGKSDRLALCIDDTYPGLNRDGRGERFFDSEGQQTAFLHMAMDQVADYQTQHHRTEAFCAELLRLDLFEAARAEYAYWSGRPGTLEGFLILNRRRLKALPPEKVLALFGADGLEFCFTHLASLHRLDLLQEAAEKEGGPALALARRGPPSPTLGLQGSALRDGLLPLLSTPPLLSKSRKISADRATEDRILLTFAPADLLCPDTPDALAQAIGIDLPPALRDLWGKASMVHVGQDADDVVDGAVNKLYLEFSLENPPEPDLVYLAVKAGATSMINRYERLVDPAGLLTQLCPDPEAKAAALLLAQHAGLLLKVHDPESDRLSLDINLANVTPEPALQAALDTLLQRLAPKAEPLRHWPSHIAIGQDKSGTAFITLYGWPGTDAP